MRVGVVDAQRTERRLDADFEQRLLDVELRQRAPYFGSG